MENITWLCDECSTPVLPCNGGSTSRAPWEVGGEAGGRIHVDVRAAQRAAKLIREANRPGESWAPADVSAALEAAGARAHWQVHHYQCDPTVEPHYKIWSSNLDTWPKVLERTLDLHAKAWFAGTDWPDFLRRRVLSQA